MSNAANGELLWEPSKADLEKSNLAHYMLWLKESRGLNFDDYDQLWSWSVTEISEFWKSIWDYFEVTASQIPKSIVQGELMPEVAWFPGARLNFAENFFARSWNDRPAVIFSDERGQIEEIGWDQIYRQSAILAKNLQMMGVKAGDRVAAYMPHIPESIIGLLATASLGAVWSSCSPDFGSRSVLDRFKQIEPKVLLAVDGYQYNGQNYDRGKIIDELKNGLPSLEATILFPFGSETFSSDNSRDIFSWSDLLSSTDPQPKLIFEQVDFSHPLWVVYSSGTTGLPKPIVQSHGGILLEHLKMAALHLDLKEGDRFFWFTSTGWMMWNFLIGGLLTGATIVVYNGSPAFPDMNTLWKLAARCGITYFGCSAAFISASIKADIKPSEQYDLGRIRAVGSTGSPLSMEGFRWIYNNINSSLSLQSVSGGTDLCTAFVGGCRLLPVYAGEIQAAALGASVKAFNEDGVSVIGQLGELVITQPMPSMPIYFWNDFERVRYRKSYFDMYPNIWRHGDWIKFTERGSCIIYGRSDSTINRQGIRMGTSEIYRVVEAITGVKDSLVVDLELLGRPSFMALFVVLAAEIELNDAQKQKIKSVIRNKISPKHVPDEIIPIDEVPYTLSGKKMEVPVRRILLGDPIEEAVNLGAMRNPDSIGFFIHLAEQY